MLVKVAVVLQVATLLIIRDTLIANRANYTELVPLPDIGRAVIKTFIVIGKAALIVCKDNTEYRIVVAGQGIRMNGSVLLVETDGA